MKTYCKVVTKVPHVSESEVPVNDGFTRIVSNREYQDGTLLIISRKKMATGPGNKEVETQYGDSFDPSTIIRATVRLLLPSGVEKKLQIPGSKRVQFFYSTTG